MKAKKSYGQHFLTDQHIAQRIADTILDHPVESIYTTLPILEVGPGTGALTQYLATATRPLIAVEADPEAVEYMHTHCPQVQILQADILRVDIEQIYPGQQIALIGNYPYNISTQIFFKLLENRDKIPICSGMLQREVAQRICAAPGSKTYGILSVLLQLWYKTEYLFTVDETVFRPMPKVKSGVLRLTRNNRTTLPCDEQQLRNIVKTSFGQRRKTLRNSLAPYIAQLKQGIQTPGLDKYLPQRPEQLSCEQFIDLTTILHPA